MFKFITERPLWVNILVGVLLVFGIFLAFVMSLAWCTHHGRSSTVPSVVGKKLDDATKLLDDQSFDVEIQDSIYVDTLPPMVVIKQVPEADEVVKENRTVYLVVNRAVPPMVSMPNLVGFSFRNAEMTLRNNDLRLGDTSYRVDFAAGSVLEQRYKGAIIAPGTNIRKGSTISLVLGSGIIDKPFAVPNLFGMRFGDAKALLESNGLVIGAIQAEGVSDTLNAYIFQQNPTRYNDEKKIQHIRPGQTMDLWLKVDKPVQDSTNLFIPE